MMGQAQAQIILDGRYIQDHFPGIGRYTYNLIDALARVAPDETFGVLHNPALANTRHPIAALARHPNLALRETDISTFSLAEQFQLPISNCQIFHSPYYLKPYFLRARSVVTLFDLIPLMVPRAVSASARLLFRALATLAARTATRVIVPSFATRADLITRLGVPREKISVISLAADARFAPQPAHVVAEMRTRYGLPDEYVLYLGSNKPHKNLATLIAACEKCKIQNSKFDWQLVIAGANASRDAATRMPVTFLHDVADADLPALYSGARVFVFPSLYEGFGLPPLEAMACGAPVICSHASSLPEVVGDAALLCDPRDAGQLADALARVLSDPALRDTLRGKALARAKQFSWERTARETWRVYRAAITPQG